MFSEPSTPGRFLEDSFSETKPPAFEGKSGLFEASIIQAKLNRRLGPEYVSQRPSPGGGPKLTYVEGWKIIGLANEVFGYNGWCSTVTRIETDFIDVDPESRRCSVGITAVVKVTLKDGTYHEDIGYGTGDNLKSKGAALDKAKKEAVTDGVKRALRNFGSLLGLCLYEKSFAQEIMKIKPQLPKFDQSDLHRREKLDTTPPTASGSRSMSPMAVSSTEDVKPVLSHPPQIRSALSKPSPLRNTVLGAGVPQDTHPHEQLAKTFAAQARPHSFNGTGQVDRLPQEGSSSKREVSLQFDMNPMAPLARQPSDPDLDSYFNDEDNDAFLAVEDPASDALNTIGSSGKGVIRNANLSSDLSHDGSPPAPASVPTSDAHVSAAPSDKPVSTLRQAIRASAASLATAAAAGVKRPAEAIRSLDQMTDDRGTPVPPTHRSPYLPHSRDTRLSPMQRMTTNSGRRAPLSDLPIEGSTDAKRVRR